MTERNIKGIVETYGEIKGGFKKDKSAYAKIGMKVAGEWHTFFGDGPEKLEAMMAEAPIGSEVTFDETQREGSQYWNFKDNTFAVLNKGSGATPKPFKQAPVTGGGTDWDAKDLRIARLAMVKQASEEFIAGKIKEDEVIPKAEKYLVFVYSNTKEALAEQKIEPVEVEKEESTNDAHEEDIYI